MNSYGQKQYRQTQVTTADKGQLVVLLYEGAINFLRKAKQAHVDGDIPAKANFINRTLDIIDELSQSLNLKDGGEIAQNLKLLYQFWDEHLVKAKISREIQPLDDIITMMLTMAEAWSKVAKDPQALELLPKESMKNVVGVSAQKTI